MASKHTGRRVVKKLLKTTPGTGVAQTLGIHPSHVYNVEYRGRVSPKLHQALLDVGLISERKKQCRLAATLTPAERDALVALAASHGLSWSALCKRLANGEYDICTL